MIDKKTLGKKVDMAKGLAEKYELDMLSDEFEMLKKNINDYKIGFNIKFILKDGTNYNGNFLEPDEYKFSDYFYVYLYDDVNQADGTFYSHLEKMDDNTKITSIKILRQYLPLR